MKPAELLCLGALLSLSVAQSEPEEVGQEEEHVDLFTTPQTKMAAATSDFGYNLFRALSARYPGDNLCLAPISISAALTQLSLGASEPGQRELFRGLRYHTLDDPRLHDTLRDLLTSLRSPGKGLATAARIYLPRKLRLKQDFLFLVDQQYGVQPKALVGGAKDVKDINDWIKQQTGNHIARFLTKPLPRNGGVSLVSAAHFKGRWGTRLSGSIMQEFKLNGEASTRIPMMQQDNYPMKMGHDPDLSCTIAQVQMQDDVSMLVFLPDDVTANLTLIEESLTAEFVQDLSMNLHPTQVSLALPVLRFSYSTDLLPLLPALGLSDWLAQTGLDKISAQPAKLGSVNHKVSMETAPEGNQYAGVAEGAGSGLSYRVDHPFLFLVRDEASGALLVVGRVLDPRKLSV